jgi:predicted carbohydrate-binding protein with CBM5 and CBM33 domain
MINMVFAKFMARFALIIGVFASTLIIGLPRIQAHGSMQTPISRIYNCFLEGPESPDSAACRAAVAVGGTQALYDWNGVRQGNANGQHQALIPDGKLCSANDPLFKGMDLPRSDWVATTLPTSGTYTFTLRATAPHRGSYYLYVTKNGYNPFVPLKWSDLETPPFSVVTDPPLINGAYQWTAQLPAGKSGRHLIYMIWQRSDSPEAFYSCSDVIFGNGQNPTATTAPTTVPTTAPSATPPPTFLPPTNTPGVNPTATTIPPTPTSSGVQEWNGNYFPYRVGDLVSYQGRVYRCIQAHTSLSNWTPSVVAALWTPIS